LLTYSPMSLWSASPVDKYSSLRSSCILLQPHRLQQASRVLVKFQCQVLNR